MERKEKGVEKRKGEKKTGKVVLISLTSIRNVLLSFNEPKDCQLSSASRNWSFLS